MKVKSIAGRLNSRELYTISLILLVGFGSFGLGRLSRLAETREPLRVEQNSAKMLQASAIAAAPLYPSKVERMEQTIPMATGGQIVASRSGSKYHYPWCSGAQRISEENKLWFNSIEDARKAGYTPASNCKGLR